MLRYLYIFILAISICSYTLFSQEIPPIQYFSPKDYMADDQNWSISQDTSENIYVANNKGLLEFNGADWTLYQSPNQAIVRSVSVINKKIYTGSYMDFGYWLRDVYGSLKYTSLSEKLNISLVDDEEFWSIIPSSEFILFQSLDRIYIYNTIKETVNTIDPNFGIRKAFKVQESIFFQTANFDIYKIQNGKAQLFLKSSEVKGFEIINIFDESNGLLFQTKSNGFYNYNNQGFKPWEIPTSNLLSSVSVYNSIRLRNGNYILGTISNGVIKIDAKGNLLFRITKKSGLLNNTVLSAFQDVSGNIWLGLDNGVNVLNLNSPYKVFKDGNGTLGTVYTSQLVGDILYLGTNQGLFYKNINTTQEFKLINSTKGQVWFLDTINGQLFCGHDNGSFLVDGIRIKEISNTNGTWNIKQVPDRSDILIQGNYDGLSIIEKSSDNGWRLKNKIAGFDISSRYFEFVSSKEILVSHEYKGVYKLTLNDDFTQIVNYEKVTNKRGIGSGLVKFHDEVYYIFQDGVFAYNYRNQDFDKSNLFKGRFSGANYISGKLIADNNEKRLWAFLKDHLIYVEPGKLSQELTLEVIDLPSDLRQSKAGFENILEISTNKYLLGTSNGYIIINTDDFQQKDFKVRINSAEYSSLQQEKHLIDLSQSAELETKQNDLYFSYSLSNFVKLTPSQYQYKLEGIYDNWSDWSTQSDILFENLPHGSYTFKVRGRVGSKLSSNIQSFSFSIQKPGYLRPLAITFYVLLFIFLTGLIQFLNRRYYKRQKEKVLIAKEKEFAIRELENDRQIMKFKNQTLKQDIESKNRELGVSTMNLIRKNEFLSSIKAELDSVKELKDLNKVVTIINKNINNTEDWKFFEEAFNNADKDFLKKIKKIHPSLTPNDLKLCAYLRLNLSSKEIAPLLNISHRSVEVKRYRLRKKMNLPHEESLTSYIIEI